MPYRGGGDWTSVVGGLAQGFSQGKAAQQQQQMMEDYRKAQTDMIKIEGKKLENQIKVQDSQQALLNWDISQSGGQIPGMGGGSAPGPMSPPPMAPSNPNLQIPGGVPGPGSALSANPFDNAVANARPAPMGATPGMEVGGGTSLPMTIAQGQTGGLVQMSPEGQKSTRYNNPYNVEYRPWQNQYGATLGEDNRFGKYPNPVAGIAAATNLIQNYAKSGLSVSQSIEKFAPTSENPNTPQRIRETANALGVDPNTPLSNVPLGPFMTKLVQYESPTQIDPAIWGDAANKPIGQTIGTNPVAAGAGQQAQPQGTLPVPVAPSPGGAPLITPRAIIEGALKKLGVEPSEAHYQKMGSHLWVLDKRGSVLGVYPGQGEYKPVEITNPDGSVTQTMQLQPPSPLPPGVPVFTTPGQGSGLGATPPSLMGNLSVKPPAYSYQPIKNASGAVSQVAVPQAQPNAGFQSEPGAQEKQAAQGIPVADVGRVNMILHAESKLKDVNSMLLPEGNVNRELIFKASAPGGGIGEGATLYSKMYQAVDAALRLETGAQANADEIKVKMDEYWPSFKDTDKAIKTKIGDLNEYIKRTVNLHDPTGQIRERVGSSIKPPNLTNKLSGGGPPPGSQPTGRTSGGNPVYKLPDGNLWVQ